MDSGHDVPDLRDSAQSILTLFKSSSEALQSSPESEYREEIPVRDFDNEHQRFRLWASNLGVFVLGHASLEYRLRDAPAMRGWALDTLSELVDQLRELLAIMEGSRLPYEKQTAPDQLIDVPQERASPSQSVEIDEDEAVSAIESSSSDSDGSDSEVAIRFRTIKDRIDSLYSFATRIRNPSIKPLRTTAHLVKNIHTEPSKRLLYMQECERFETRIVDHIHRQERSRPSQASNISTVLLEARERITSIESVLINRIGKANARRRQQFIYWREHANRLAGAPASVRRDIRASLERRVSGQSSRMPDEIDANEELASAILRSQATSASVLDPNIIPAGGQQSVITRSSRMSTARGAKGEALLWPRPPQNAAGGKYFLCPFCLTICPSHFLEDKAWRIHLARDLEPYQCTFQLCDKADRLYGSRKEWIQHEESAHARAYRCVEHLSDEFPSYELFSQHMRQNHDSSSAPIELGSLVDLCQDTPASPRRACPFCQARFEQTEKMYNHLAFHLEKYALLALPNDLDEDSDSDSEDGGDSKTAKADIRARHETGSRAHDFDLSIPLEFFDSGSAGSETSGKQLKAKLSSSQVEQAEPVLGRVDKPPQKPSLENWLNSVAINEAGASFEDPLSNTTKLSEQTETNDNARNHDDLKQLIKAIKANDTDGVRVLLDQQIDANQVDEDDWTPLIYAVFLERSEIIDLLLTRGADVNFRSEREGDALRYLASYGNVGAIEQLLAWGADINATDLSLGTALACVQGGRPVRVRLEIAQCLLRHGADPNIPGGPDCYPLITALCMNDKVMVELLLSHGANPNLGGGFYETALVACCDKDRENMIPALVNAGAEVNFNTRQFGTVLHKAASNGLLTTVQELLRHGANPNAFGRDVTNTPLHDAAMGGHADVVQALVRAGADKDKYLSQGTSTMTALDIARAWGNEDVVRVLE